MIKVSNAYGGYNKRTIISDINFNVKQGESIYIMGSNGCGKTTLIKLILNLLDFSQGDILINGEKVCSSVESSKHISYIPQSHEQPFSFTVFEMVMMGRIGQAGIFSRTTSIDIEKVNEALDHLNILHLSDSIFNTLSKGQKKMALIARAICTDNSIIAMDEPYSSLDYKNQALLKRTIQNMNNNGYSFIISTHGINFVDDNSNLLLLKNGKQLYYDKACDIINDDIISNLYDVDINIKTIEKENKKQRFITF